MIKNWCQLQFAKLCFLSKDSRIASTNVFLCLRAMLERFMTISDILEEMHFFRFEEQRGRDRVYRRISYD